LPFVLRRACWQISSADQVTDRLRGHWPDDRIEQTLKRIKRQSVLGWVWVNGLVRGPANEFYFTIYKSQIESRYEQMIRLAGFEVAGGPGDLSAINRALQGRALNCWISERPGGAVGAGLPPLFALYTLRPLAENGHPSTALWSIAFGLDAFLL